jgi:glyoxylase-like metal-dependent hydrolase (beta-lactamase superfamily II)
MGVGVGNEVIDEWYQPHTTLLLDALCEAGVAPSEVAAVVVSHLHFDNCGQQRALSVPVYVQATEFEVAQIGLHGAGLGGDPRRPVAACSWRP